MGTVNVHASLLPRHRGSAPIPWAILCGDAVTGVTTMLTDRGIDTGDMLLRVETPISDTDTAGTLTLRLADMGAALLLDTIRRLAAGDCPREKQNEAAMTYDPKLTKEMGELTLNETTRNSLLRVRAMAPWPSAYLTAANGALKVWQATEYPAKADRPGTVLFADQQHGLVVSTLDGAMELVSVQAPNAKRMEARAYLRGHLMEAGKPLDEVMI
jgi:methionyl-tRNA formyltransferase